MKGDRFFTAWFIFCGVMAMAGISGCVWAVIYLLPHVVGMLDRVGQ